MLKIMSVNAGSSSLKFQLLKMPVEEVLCQGVIEKIGMKDSIYTIKYNGNKEEVISDIKDHTEAVNIVLKDLIEKNILSDLSEIDGVGHRVVQGGEIFQSSVLVTKESLDNVKKLADLAPLHNKANAIGVEAFEAVLPNVPQVLVFDTTFHQSMEKEAFLYATPYEWYEKYKIRKYGMHGTSHRFVSLRAAELLGKKPEECKIIVCHVGNGSSICAVKYGKSVDTSMGLTPLAGIPMGTRSGDIDPAIIGFIAEKENLSASEIVNILNKKSGYLGVSGVGSDARDLTEGMSNGCERCSLTFDMQAKRIVDYVSSYYVYMGGADAIVFTAGIGENVIHLRKNIIDRLNCLGIYLDEEKNNIRAVEREISTPESSVKVYIIPTNEEVMIARDTIEVANLK